jgi:hypothetical protein
VEILKEAPISNSKIDGKNWDFGKLIRIFNPADSEEIARIKIQVDFVRISLRGTWRNPAVRSACNLALRLKIGQESQATSSAPDGARKLWSYVWSGRVPPKVNVFIWKLARNNLPTRRAKFIRRLEPSDICPLCDRESETSYHATVTCPRAVGLRMAMRDCWHLPEEVKFRYAGPVSLLVLLDQCTEEERDLTKLLLWKTWSIHNNITHQSDPTGIPEATHALYALHASFTEIRVSDTQVSGKGKKICSSSGNRRTHEAAGWEPPPAGWIKFNVDESHVPQSGEARVGVVARDSRGQVETVLGLCQDAAEAEA